MPALRVITLTAEAKDDHDWDELWATVVRVSQLIGSRVSDFSLRTYDSKGRRQGQPRVADLVAVEESTMALVEGALAKAGLGDQQIIDAINEMQNVGILFRERL